MRENRRFFLYSLGCPKNLVDSEWLSSRLMDAGWKPTEGLFKADIVIVNTCSFIKSAVKESINAIFTLYSSVPRARFIVTGCLPLRYGRSLRDLLPEVSTFFLSRQMENVDKATVEKLISDKGWIIHRAQNPAGSEIPRRITSTPFYTAYVKIADGCNRGCTFCTLPAIRGRYRSRPMDNIIHEVKDLAARGVKEIVLVAQDTAKYGTDLGKETTLALLLDNLASIEGVRWIKLQYLYPDIRLIDYSLVEVMKRHDKICPVVDIPIQHASNKVLRRMRRPKMDSTRRVLHRLREVPGVLFRTTVMVGFPGETEEDFDCLCEFIEEGWFISLGVFPYSDEEGTHAFDLPHKVPEEEKQRRLEVIMEIQQRVSQQFYREFIGDILPVLVEGLHEETDLLLRGRTAFQYPEIDGCVVINKGAAEVGQIVPVRITDAGPYDLVGEVVDERD